MTTQREEETGTVIRYHRVRVPRDSGDDGSCQGCRELAVRVDRLERKLAEHFDGDDERLASHDLSTTTCYWNCVGVHALCLFFLYSSDELIQIGMMLSFGAFATLVVTHVFTNRPIHQRVPRSLLSATLVATAAVLGMLIGDVAEPSEVMPYLIYLFPPLFASAWITAKLFVWVRGWRIVPPGYSTRYPRLQIQHLLLGTLLAALYLAVIRFVTEDLESLLGDDLSSTLMYVCIPTMACTFVSGLLAKTVLNSPRRVVIPHAFLMALAATVILTIVFQIFLAIEGEFVVGWDIVLLIAVNVIPITLGVIASSGGTFAMMRIAKYRFVTANTEQGTRGKVLGI